MTDWLIDKSALVRLAASPDAAEWASRIERGLVRITTVTRLEVGYSARSGADLRAGLRRPPVSAMPVEYLTPTVEDRAVEVLMLLADRGQHRAPSVPDLIIAALEAHARRLGLSRTEYVRRRLAQDAAVSESSVSTGDLARFAATFGDLADTDVMTQAWQ